MEASFKIIGTDLQYIEFVMPPKSFITSIQGVLLYKDLSIESEVLRKEQDVTKNGFLKKVLYGQSFQVVEQHKNKTNSDAICCIEPTQYGQITTIDLKQYESKIFLQKENFLCAIGSTNFSNTVEKRLPANNNTIKKLEQTEGNGTVFLQSEGIVIKKELNPNDTLLLNSSSNLLGCTNGIKLKSNEEEPSRLKKILVNRPTEIQVSGPGTIWIQSTSFSRTKNKIGNLIGGPEQQKKSKSMFDRVFS